MNTFKTPKPQLSDAAVATIRRAAHRYVRSGGSLFPDAADAGERTEHVGNLVPVVTPGHTDTFEEALKAVDLPPAVHEQLWNAAWGTVNAYADAAFMFGLFVAFEVAAFTACPPVVTTTATRKGGAR